MATDRDARIQERAYHLWIEEGRPQGRHEEHWHRAERELIEEEWGLLKAPPATAARAGAGAVGTGSGQDPATTQPAAAGRPAAGLQTPDQPKADQPKAGPRARRARPAAADSTTHSGARGGRRSAAAKPAG